MKASVWFVPLLLCASWLGACADEPPARTPAKVTAPADGRVAVTVDSSGYRPASIEALAGKELTLVFTRVEEVGCGEEVVFPEQKIRKPLPVGTPVEIRITPDKAGTIGFACGMDMMKGAVVVLAP